MGCVERVLLSVYRAHLRVFRALLHIALLTLCGGFLQNSVRVNSLEKVEGVCVCVCVCVCEIGRASCRERV